MPALRHGVLPRLRVPIAALLGAVVLTGCLTGERPTLADELSPDSPTGDANIDAVLQRLATVDDAVFTAGYDVTNNFGPLTEPAVVVQTADGRRSITIGETRFIIEGSTTATCDLTTGSCSDTIDDAAVSDLQVTHQFYGRSPASRLRTDAGRRVGPTEAYVADFAGVTATCVSVPVTGGNKVYCATDAGVLASYQGPDTVVTLTSFEPVADEARFSRTE